jgi:hypothetical protein
VVLVSNSPAALGKRIGGLINQFEIVVRFNNYILNKKVADYVGTKTDVWAVSPGYFLGGIHPEKLKPRPPHTILFTPMWNGRYDREVWRECNELCKEEGIGINTFKLAVEADAFCRGLNKGKRVDWLMTGEIALAHYIQKYGRVAVVGFDYKEVSRGVHYGTKRGFNNPHNFQTGLAWFTKFKSKVSKL